MADEWKEIARLKFTGEDFDDGAANVFPDGPPQRDPGAPSNEDRILEIAKTVPHEEWERLATDLSQRLDFLSVRNRRFVTAVFVDTVCRVGMATRTDHLRPALDGVASEGWPLGRGSTCKPFWMKTAERHRPFSGVGARASSSRPCLSGPSGDVLKLDCVPADYPSPRDDRQGFR